MAELSAQPRLARSRDVQGKSTRSARGPQRKGEHEQATAAGLDLLRVLGWLVLHDVTIPADPTNGVAEVAVDHVLAGPSGVYVVNTVSWSGAITAAEGVLTVGKNDHSDVLAEAAAAADVVRTLLGGTPVAPLLCFERLEAVAGVAGDVALCASENILDLLTSQPQILDDAAVAKASGRLAAACRALRGAPAVTAKAPVRDQPAPRPVVGPTVEELARARAEQLAAQAATDAAASPAALVDEPERHERHERHGLARAFRRSRRSPVVADPVVDPVVDPLVDEAAVEPLVELGPDPLAVEPTDVESAETGTDPGLAGADASSDEHRPAEPSAPESAPVGDSSADAAEAASTEAGSVARLSNSAVAEAGAALWRSLTEPVHHQAEVHQHDGVAEPVVTPPDVEPAAGEPLTPEPGLGPVDELDVEAAFAEAEAKQRAAEEGQDAGGAAPAPAPAPVGADEVSEPLEHDPELEAQLRAAREAQEARARAAQELLEEARREAEEAEARELAERAERERAEAEARERAERERVERERAEAEAREREERERVERERAEAEAREREERERVERERAEAEERARLEAEAREREERERVERERAEAEERARLEAEAREREERERVERERAEAEERARLEAEAREREERERVERERAEAEAREREERERVERERAEAEERARLEAEAREREERERVERERAEAEAREREERERVERERAEAEAREREERERVERERAEAEAREREERERVERERAEAEERARLEAEAREREERERVERERAEAEERARVEAEAEQRRHLEEQEREQAEQERRREEAAQEAAARAAWEARLRAAREAREREAHEAVAVPDIGDQGAMAVLRAHQPDVRQGELLLPEPDLPGSPGVTTAELPAAELSAGPVEPTAEVDLGTWEPALDDGSDVSDVVPDEPQVEEPQWEAPAALVAPRERESARVADADVVDAPIADPRLDAPAGEQSHGLRASWSRRRRRRRAAEGGDGASQGQRFPARAMLHVALGALLIAGVIVGAPRAHVAVSWVQHLVGGSDGTVVGTLVDVGANTEHPAVEVLAGAPVDVPPAVAAAGKGKHLVVVPLRLHNQGTDPWQVPVAARATVMDGLGVTHPVAKAVKAVKGYPLLPGKATVAPDQETKGYVAFTVPDGRTITSVTLGLSQAGQDAVTWQVRP